MLAQRSRGTPPDTAILFGDERSQPARFVMVDVAGPRVALAVDEVRGAR